MTIVIPRIYPPLVRDSDFTAVDTENESNILGHFAGIVSGLHRYLNQLPCVADIQHFRRKWTRPKETQAFGTFAAEARHWYTFNHGGRNEAQFNIGLWPTHVRIGLGFEFSQRKGGDPTIVGLVYSCFLNQIRSDLNRFRTLVEENGLEGEWAASSGNSALISNEQVTDWLLNLPEEPIWVFFGRLLRRGSDSTILESEANLDRTIESVFSELRPIWERTQTVAAALR